MIRVRRSAVTTPAALAGARSDGRRERAAAERFFGITANRAEKFPGGFKVYKDKGIKLALEELFHGKCAYCESLYDRVHPVDIDHYRPKAAVEHKASLRKPGYYWLAAEWTNLLPSCIDCNRSRAHPSLAGVDPELSGKANWFPIGNEDQRAEGPGQESREKRLLLDPCRDRPETHLVFQDDALVEATSRKGERSVEVYGLNRLALVLGRRDVRVRVMNQMKHATRALVAAKRKRSRASREVLAEELRDLLALRRDAQPYAGMARRTSDPYLELMAGKLRRTFAGVVPAGLPPAGTVEAFVTRYVKAAEDRPVPLAEVLADLAAV